jgi:hypothetical protein
LVTKTTPKLLVEQLKKNGIIVNDQSLTIEQIASSNKKSKKALLGAILERTKSSETKDGDND